MNNLLQKFDGLDEQGAWNVMTALRGPDNDSGGLKDLLTVPLRNWLLDPPLSMQHGAYVKQCYDPGSVSHREHISRAIDNMILLGMDGNWGPSHFEHHVYWATLALFLRDGGNEDLL